MNIYKTAMKRLSFLFAVLVFCIGASCADTNVRPVQELAGRLLGSSAEAFRFSIDSLDSGTTDVFRISSDGSTVDIAGNNVNSLAVGLNYYLKHCAGTSVSWYAADPVFIPERLIVPVDTVTVTARVPERFFLNYCTFGYSMPYWNEAQWERLIDWMALNGVNMPLAITGQEAVWLDVWQRYGLDAESIRSYFTGPAHLPWHRMCNIDGYQGPLPQEWIDNQTRLQKFIVKRERELGMKPVLPAFSGHVPAALKKVYPEASMTDVGKWGGFDSTYMCSYLSPDDPLFAKIQRDYIEAQTRLYGTDHLYGIDCFNEVRPPSWEPSDLRTIGNKVFASLDAADPQGMWVQMAWLFYYDRKNWTPERVEAYLDGVPRGRMKFLDYYGDFVELWPDNDGFHGHDFIWCYLGNFGGNSFIAGDHAGVKARIDKAVAEAASLTGIGSTLEGLDVNPYMYEAVFDRAWNVPLDENERIASLARRRSGDSESAREAWQILADSVYTYRIRNSQGTLDHARPAFEGNGSWVTLPKYSYDNADLARAWGKLIESADSAAGRDTYLFDLVNVGRQVLANQFIDRRDNFSRAYAARDTVEMHAAADTLLMLIDDSARLLACHRSFSMKGWIDDARNNISDNAALKDYFEKNARTLVTFWGSRSLTDYANRAYAELTDQYYGERWRRFVDAVFASVRRGEAWAQKEFDEQMRAFEAEWPDPARTAVRYLPAGDALATAAELYRKWVE